MNLVRVQVFADKYHKILLLLCLLLIIIIDAYVISQRSIHLSDGISSTWWMIIHNEESGLGYKACDPTYIPNCQLTDQATAIREPVPVFFFAVIGRLTNNSLKAFQISQLFLNLLICLLVYFLAREIGSRTLGLLAAFGWAVYVQAVHNLLHISGDLIAGLFVVAGVLSFIRALKSQRVRDWIFFGFLWGLASLSRSSTLLMFLPLLAGSIIHLWRSGKFKSGWYQPFLAAVAFGLVLSPWVIRNEIVFGKPILGTTLVGYNLYRHNAIVIPETAPHYVGPREASSEVKSLVAVTPELRRPVNEARVDQIFQQAALQLIRKYPDEYMELVAFRILPLWFNYGVMDQYGEKMALVDQLIVIQQSILLVIFLVAVWKGNWYSRLLAVCVLIFMLGYLAVDSQLRYLTPAIPLIISIGTIGVDQFIRSWTGKGGLVGNSERLKFRRN